MATANEDEGIIMKIEQLPDGGMVESNDSGIRYWSLNGLLHREGGPAIEYNDAYGFKLVNNKWWFYHGDEFFPANNEKWLRLMKMKALL